MPDMIKRTVTLSKDASGAPASNLSNLPPDLKKRADKAGISLSKRGLPAAMPDLAFTDAMIDEWDTLIKEAINAGILAS